MKYELISKDVLDEVCEALLKAKTLTAQPVSNRSEIKLELQRAYDTIQRNRTQCNVGPEGD